MICFIGHSHVRILVYVLGGDKFLIIWFQVVLDLYFQDELNCVFLQRLEDMNVELLPVETEGKNFGLVNHGDVVILPAFGAAVQEMQILNDKGVQIVDTTCPWVSKVC